MRSIFERLKCWICGKHMREDVISARLDALERKLDLITGAGQVQEDGIPVRLDTLEHKIDLIHNGIGALARAYDRINDTLREAMIDGEEIKLEEITDPDDDD